MAVVDIYSASPLNSDSSEQSTTYSKVDSQSRLANQPRASSTVEPETMMEMPLMFESNPKTTTKSSPTSNIGENAVKQSTSITDRAVPRIDTRTASTTTATHLPWKIDETSSATSSASHIRKASFVPPPRSRYGQSVDYGYGGPLSQPVSATAMSPVSVSSPYQSSTPNSYTQRPNLHNRSHTIDFSHPPNYTQNPGTSFSENPPSSHSYSNSTPFYHNNQSYSSSLASPMSPARRGRGILDNDPDLYLRGEGDGEEETMWDTAAKWARAAGKRLSAGEQTLWKMVNAVANGDGER